jgi:hypothetical protein
MPHPRDPSLLSREDGEKVEKLAVEVAPAAGDLLAGRDDPARVAEMGDAVEPRRQRPDIFLDAPTISFVHRRES